jgi:dTMP kinase
MNVRGLFITFEGPDGAGKSTQIKKLADHLEKEGISYVLTREPGGTMISDQIRAILLNPVHGKMSNETEVLLYAASRAQHVSEKIMPALNEGRIVLCDRFIDASIAYQGYGLGLDIEKVKSTNQFAAGGLAPHRSYYIDLSPETGRKRMLARQKDNEKGGLDRIEQKQLDYHERVRQGFYSIYEENRSRICFLDGEEERETLFSKIKTDFQKFYSEFQR